MLKVREEQLKVFEDAALRAFEDEMVEHSKTFSPVLTKLLDDDQLRVALRQAMERARRYGFTNRGSIRLYVDLMFLCGSDFDTDPLVVGIGEELRATGDQMERAERIHKACDAYLADVSGPANINVRRALEELAVFARDPPEFDEQRFETIMLSEMTRVFPQRADFVGKARLMALIRGARIEARKFGLPPMRADALLIILAYAFGHGCTRDPLYPWISQTLIDPRITDPAARAQRLERKAITWLDHVLAEHRE